MVGKERIITVLVIFGDANKHSRFDTMVEKNARLQDGHKFCGEVHQLIADNGGRRAHNYCARYTRDDANKHSRFVHSMVKKNARLQDGHKFRGEVHQLIADNGGRRAHNDCACDIW